MALKKRLFTDDEIAIFDDDIVYKRGEYRHFRMWPKGEGILCARSSSTGRLWAYVVKRELGT